MLRCAFIRLLLRPEWRRDPAPPRAFFSTQHPCLYPRRPCAHACIGRVVRCSPIVELEATLPYCCLRSGIAMAFVARTFCALDTRAARPLERPSPREVFSVTLSLPDAYTHMTQRNDIPPVANHPDYAPTSKAKAFLRQHRFGFFVGGLLAVVAVAGIANARPGAGHSTCCMTHTQDAAATATPDPSGKVLITADGRGFHPSSIEITKGQRTTLEFRRTTDETCATSVVFPELKIEKALPLNQTVTVEVPADTSSTLTFQCGMGMYHGKVVVH